MGAPHWRERRGTAYSADRQFRRPPLAERFCMTAPGYAVTSPSPIAEPVAPLPRCINARSALLLVMANMIGMGVFVTSGYFLLGVNSGWTVLTGWLVGGVTALFGAMAYAELGAMFPDNGGEYQFLTRIYHPALGFSAACGSLVVGFAAPLASFGLLFGRYFQVFWPDVSPPVAGLVLLTVLAVVQSGRLTLGQSFQDVATVGKLLLMAGLIAAGFAATVLLRTRGVPLANFDGFTAGDARQIFERPFANSLVYVSFAYAGWNSAAYVAGEILSPQRTIPRVLLLATVIVTLLYCGLNWSFLAVTPRSEIIASEAAVERFAVTAGKHLLGERGGTVVAFLIMTGFISSAGALIITGTRVTEAVGRHYRRLGILAFRRPGGGPIFAIALQWLTAAGLLICASAGTLLDYTGATLILFNMLSVLGLVVLRIRSPDQVRPYRAWGYPFTPLIFLGLQAWVLWSTVQARPVVAAWSVATILLGIVGYAAVRSSVVLGPPPAAPGDDFPAHE